MNKIEVGKWYRSITSDIYYFVLKEVKSIQAMPGEKEYQAIKMPITLDKLVVTRTLLQFPIKIAFESGWEDLNCECIRRAFLKDKS
jgi:hypothetical protein